MAQVELTINGRTYQVACDDGEEDHLLNLADYLNRKVVVAMQRRPAGGDLAARARALVEELKEQRARTAEEREGGGRALQRKRERGKQSHDWGRARRQRRRGSVVCPTKMLRGGEGKGFCSIFVPTH